MRAIRRWFFERSLHRQLAQKKQSSRARSWKAVRTIGLLFDARDPDRRKWALAWAEKWKKEGKKPYLLGFVPEAEADADFPFPCFSRKQLDWCYRPTAPAAREFLQRPLHLLILPEEHPPLPLHYLAALCPADLKAGFYQPELDYLDLSIDLPSRTEPDRLIQDIRQLLTTISTENSPTHGAAV